MNVGIVNQGIYPKVKNAISNKTTPEFSTIIKEESVHLKKSERNDVISNNNAPVSSCDNTDALYDDLAKRYDLTDIKQSDFSSFLDELYDNGLITEWERIIAGGVYLVDTPLENKASEKTYGRQNNERFNAAADYSKSYLDYAQSINYGDHQVIKDAILAHNKVSEIIGNIAQRRHMPETAK